MVTLSTLTTVVVAKVMVLVVAPVVAVFCEMATVLLVVPLVFLTTITSADPAAMVVAVMGTLNVRAVGPLAQLTLPLVPSDVAPLSSWTLRARLVPRFWVVVVQMSVTETFCAAKTRLLPAAMVGVSVQVAVPFLALTFTEVVLLAVWS